MDMDMTIVHVEYSGWFRAATYFSVIFLFAGVSLARRNGRPLLILSLPILLNVPVSALGVLRVLEGLSLSGGGRASTAAGAGESVLVLAFGLIVSAFITAIAALLGRRRPFPQESLKPLLALWLLAAAVVTVELFVVRHAVQTGMHSEKLLIVAKVALSFAVLMLAIALAYVVLASFRPSSSAPAAPRRFFFSAVAFGALAVVAWEIIELLRTVASGVASAPPN